MLRALFSSSSRIRLLRLFLMEKGARFYLRELQAKTGLSPRTVQVELARLTGAGILDKEVSGNRTYYEVNDKCPIVQELRSMFVKTVGVADVLRRALEAKRNAIHVAFIFGSFATGTDTSRSDVDVMVIGDVSFGDVVSALRPTEDELSREVNPSVYSLAEVRRRIAADDHFITRVMQGEKILLIGGEDELRELVE